VAGRALAGAFLEPERKYFGTDGIRGRANAFPVTPEFAMKVGQAGASPSSAASIATAW
jgi:phosphomannomutase